MSGGSSGGPPALRGSAALEHVAAFRPHAAVVFGSGLAMLPKDAVVRDELAYVELGWPRTAVPGHANRLSLVEAPAGDGARLQGIINGDGVLPRFYGEAHPTLVCGVDCELSGHPVSLSRLTSRCC